MAITKEANVTGEKSTHLYVRSCEVIEQFKPHLTATLGERDSGRLKGVREEEI